MDIDISVLRLMEREKELPFEVLARAIEEALLTAYGNTEGAVPGARVELNRKSGHVAVLVPERDDEGHKIGEYDATPEGFGRVAASTARSVILQRLRDAEDEQKYGHFAGVEGGARPVQLDLHQRLGDVAQGDGAAGAVDIERDLVLRARDDPAGEGLLRARRHGHEPADVASPVPGQLERPADAAGGDLQRVGARTHDRGLVQGDRQGLGGLGDVVQQRSGALGAVAVDDDAQHPALAGRHHLHRVEVEPVLGQDRGQQPGDLALFHGVVL